MTERSIITKRDYLLERERERETERERERERERILLYDV